MRCFHDFSAQLLLVYITSSYHMVHLKKLISHGFKANFMVVQLLSAFLRDNYHAMNEVA